MNVSELAGLSGAEILCGSDDALSREVSGGYCGDLLSWVMGRAPDSGVWITIMSNPNVAAVAHLADVACVLLAEDVRPDDALLARMKEEDMPLLISQSSAFDLAGMIYRALRG